MKTLKMKVVPAEGVRQKIDDYREELVWIWNKMRWLSLHNHSLDWYSWAENNSPEGLLDGIVRVPLRFSRRGAWNYASCKIATGGPNWMTDKSKVINYRVLKGGKWEERNRYGVSLNNEGAKPYVSITPKEFSFPTLDNGTIVLSDLNKLSVKTVLSKIRKSEGLKSLTMETVFIRGCYADFTKSWSDYLSVKKQDKKLPKFRTDSTFMTLYSSGKECISIRPNGIKLTNNIVLLPDDKHWANEFMRKVSKSVRLIEKPSGMYLCIAMATESEAKLPALKVRKTKAVGKKKEAAENIYERMLVRSKNEIYEDATTSNTSRLIAGLDPGIKVVAALDNGHNFSPNTSRLRIEVHISKLSGKLYRTIRANDIRLGLRLRHDERQMTKNESKLRKKIARCHERAANSSNAFNHKLSTRLVKTYGTICWEDTNLLNISKSPRAKLSTDGSKYLKNGKAAKAGLNRSIRTACLGDLVRKSELKAEASRKRVVRTAPNNSSKECHCCGDKGIRPHRDVFQCTNSLCDLHLVVQHADTNAALNHKKRGMEKLALEG